MRPLNGPVHRLWRAAEAVHIGRVVVRISVIAICMDNAVLVTPADIGLVLGADVVIELDHKTAPIVVFGLQGFPIIGPGRETWARIDIGRQIFVVTRNR